MNIIDHLSVGVPAIDLATKFYDEVLGALGIQKLAVTDAFAAYGKDTVQFLLMKPENGALYSTGNGTHICFSAEMPGAVDRFHRAALEQGGTCEGEPGPRPAYPIADVYAAFVRDPFGNKLEVIHNGFST